MIAVEKVSEPPHGIREDFLFGEHDNAEVVRMGIFKAATRDKEDARRMQEITGEATVVANAEFFVKTGKEIKGSFVLYKGDAVYLRECRNGCFSLLKESSAGCDRRARCFRIRKRGGNGKLCHSVGTKPH